MAEPINALVVNSIMYNDTDGIRCVVPNHRYQGALEAFKDSHVLFKKELRNRVHLVHKDVDAHYMWI